MLRAARALKRVPSILAASKFPTGKNIFKIPSSARRNRYVFFRPFCDDVEKNDPNMSAHEAKRLLRQVNVQALKKQLRDRDSPCMDYSDLSQMCRDAGCADSAADARKLALALDEAGDIILFRNKVYLDPQQIADLVANALPLRLIREDDPRVKEFEQLQQKMHSIDEIADRQVRKFMWFGLFTLTAGTGLLVRLTFWELSWDVMEPIAFFMTSGFLIAGYAYFLLSRRDPTYQGLMHSLLANRRRRLVKSMKFDYERYKALEKQCDSCRPLVKKRRPADHDDEHH